MVIGRSLAYSLRLRHIREGEGNMADEKPDIARWVDEGAKAIGLPIASEYRANVMVNIERSLVIVQPLLAVELDDELTPAPVFRP
jgi:1-carboxybiuret hydrolase subunit AtzG-like protein